MTLRRKTLLIIGVTIIGLVVILSITSQTILMSGFEQLEQDDIRLNTERVISAILDDIAEVSSSVSDWAYWNDTLDFVEGNYPEYVDDNLAATTLQNLRLNFMLFTNSSGELVHGIAVDLQSGDEIPVPDGLSTYIAKNPQLINHPNEESVIEGIILTQQGPMIIASRPVLTNEQEGPPHGALLMGRFLDDQAVQLLAETTQLSISVYFLEDAQLPEDVQFATSNLSLDEPIFIQPLDSENVAGYAQVYDVFENPILIIRANTPRDIYKQGQISVRYFTVAMLVFGLIFTVASMLQLERGILARVTSISRSVGRIGLSGDLGERIPVSGQDELSSLSIIINQMLDTIQEGGTQLEERTSELEKSSAQIQQRASQLEAIADVASSIASLQDVNELLPYITKTISERFGFYHAGIFLLSENKEYAVLRAANSEGGQKMLARKHQLRVGKEGIVGFAVGRKTTRIALDVGEDAVYFNNPDLPFTRSEMALPLTIGSDVIGVLDVQSEQPNAFSNEDVEVLNTLANQVAVAIENARLFEQSQRALQELENTFQRYVSNEWRQFASQSKVIGYRARESGLEPITDAVGEFNNGSAKKIPIKLRGNTLGALSIDMGKRSQDYTEEEASLIQTIADRLALALESARLLEDSQRAAAKEQTIGQITGKIGSSVNLRNVLQTAVEELGRNIPGSEIVIQLQSNQDKAREEQG